MTATPNQGSGIRLAVRNSFMLPAITISIALWFGLYAISSAVSKLKPEITMHEHPVTIKVIEAPRPNGYLPGVR